MEKRKNPLLRFRLVGHMLEVIRLDLEHQIAGYLSAACRGELAPEHIEALGYCCSLSALLENTHDVLIEGLDDPAIAALAPDQHVTAH